jgi:hypothetical protein
MTQGGLSAPDDRLPFSPAVGCLASIVIGLLAAGLLFNALRLARDGELRFGDSPTAPRLWLVNEAGDQGVGISTAEVLSRDFQGAGICLTTRVRFLLWRQAGADTSIDYCDCYQPAGNGWQFAGRCPAELQP